MCKTILFDRHKHVYYYDIHYCFSPWSSLSRIYTPTTTGIVSSITCKFVFIGAAQGGSDTTTIALYFLQVLYETVLYATFYL